ncbi:MAG: hypothetical protein EA381_14630 [Planctomycetaceae bacterium]|nr:MAG: hypothetical protein EA381_14630 [Planctomycetaceae bacterium]
MLHVLDKLYKFLLRVSRVPGLGFLQREASSVLRFKGSLIEMEDRAEGTKQGIGEGAGAMRDLFGKGGKQRQGAAAAGQTQAEVGPEGAAKRGGAPQRQAPSGGPAQGAPVRSDRPQKPSSDVRVQKKLLMKKLRG